VDMFEKRYIPGPAGAYRFGELVKMLPSEIKDPHTFENNTTGSKPIDSLRENKTGNERG
jgi:hypothetical protein